MKYKIGDVVTHILTGKIYRIVGTKDTPYVNNAMPFNKVAKVEPPYDYIIMQYESTDEHGHYWSGITAVQEKDLEPCELGGKTNMLE